MPWPQTVDFNSAIQNPECFRDPDLRAGRAADGMIPGIPLSYAGNFATVYKVEGPGGAWAVKCFTRKVQNLTQRYKEISAHLARRRRRFAVGFQYLEEGVQIGGAWYPVVKMQWVEGETLNAFLRDRVGNARLLEQLCKLWLRLGHDLREDQTAHGDLQHGNILLVPGSNPGSILLRLVDYDGMWVPALAGLPPGEVGHPNYQHPQRLAQGGYGPDIDRFSHLAVYTALRCLVVGGRALWAAFDNEENVLFREADFKHPARSKLFPLLLALDDPHAAALAGHLILASQSPLARTPLLDELLDGDEVVPLSPGQRDRLHILGVPLPAALSSEWFSAAASGPHPPPPAPAAPAAAAAAPAPAAPPDATAAAAPAASEATLEQMAAQQPTAEQPAVALNIPYEQRQVAAELFARAAEVVRINGDPAYAQQLLLSSCRLDPTSIEHRELLREVGRALAGRKRGGLFDSLGNLPARGRMRAARHAGDHRKALEHGEDLLARHPNEVAVEIEMAESAESLGLPSLAIWFLKDALRAAPGELQVLRALGRLCERLQRYGPAVVVWRQVQQLAPTDTEAATKVKELAAWDTIARTASVV
jgi:hypothetical protein